MNYKEQVELDLRRTHLDASSQQVISKRIQKLLQKYPFLHYYQGFHDVALNTKSFDELESLSLIVLRDFMTETLYSSLAVLSLVSELLLKLDPQLPVKNIQPHYALAPIITLFAHDTQDCKDILSNSQKWGLKYALYLYAAVILKSKPDILKQLDGETDPDIVHSVLSRTSSKITELDRKETHELARKYMTQVPIHTLPSYKKLSRYSALRGVLDLQRARNAAKKLGEKEFSYIGLTLGLLIAAVAVQFVMSTDSFETFHS